MRATALVTRTIVACRRGLVLLAALSFVLSGMASIHTAHAIAGGHDLPAAKSMAQDGLASHCDSHEQQGPETKENKQFSCCAFTCAPLMVLATASGFAMSPAHGDIIIPLSERLVLDRQIAGLFRPPRSLA